MSVEASANLPPVLSPPLPSYLPLSCSYASSHRPALLLAPRPYVRPTAFQGGYTTAGIITNPQSPVVGGILSFANGNGVAENTASESCVTEKTTVSGLNPVANRPLSLDSIELTTVADNRDDINSENDTDTQTTGGILLPASTKEGTVDLTCEGEENHEDDEKPGKVFIRLMENEELRLRCQCEEVETYMSHATEEGKGRIRALIGKSNLLINKKFKQFRGLCQQNLDEESEFITAGEDLAGFWDMVMIQVFDIRKVFDDVKQLHKNGWRSSSGEALEEKPVKKPKSKTRRPDTHGDSEARQDARRRLAEAKRAIKEKQASHQNSQLHVAENGSFIVSV